MWVASGMAALIIPLLCFLCVCFLFILIKFLHKVWWTPLSIQHVMQLQGIKGPCYKFLHGNTKEVFIMRKEATSRPIDIMHHLMPVLQPDVYAWTKLYGKTYLSWYGTQAQLEVTESEMIKEILNNKDGAFPKAEPPVYFKKIVGDGLLTTASEKWGKLRKLANHAFHGESLKGMIPAMIASTEMMLERWKKHEGREIEVFEEFRLLTSEVISRTAFGSSYLEGEQIFEMLSKLSLIFSRSLFKIRFPGIRKISKTSDEIESEKLEKGIRDTIVAMIKKREEKLMTGELDSYGSDFLGMLVKANHDADESKRITIHDIVDECKTFYLAGQETTNTLLAWTIFLLAIHTDWQEKARIEVLQLFDQQIPNFEGLARLKTMNMIINESLRLYSPVIGLQRKTKGNVRLGKFNVPANLHLNMSIIAVHNDPHIWGEDSHLFKPERFSEGVAKATNNNAAAFLPFGLGPRTCVGMNFAFNEAKIALSMILQRYSFTRSPAYVHSPYQVITIRPQHGVQVILHAIKGINCSF